MPTNTELADQIFAAINAHDVDALRELWAEEVEERFPDKTCRGKEELAAHFKGLFAAMSDMRMEKVASVEEGETVFVRWTLTGTHDGVFTGIDPTGKRIALDGFTLAFPLAGLQVQVHAKHASLSGLPPWGDGAR